MNHQHAQLLYLVGIGSQRNTEGSRQSEIRQLQVTLTVDQQVLRLQVAVQDSVAVTITNSLDQLGHKFLHHGIAQSHVPAEVGAIREDFTASTLTDRKSLHILFEVEVQEFEHEIELVAVGMDNVQQSHDVRIVHFFQQGDFTDRRAGNALIFRLQSDLLQGDNAVGMGELAGLVNDAIRS